MTRIWAGANVDKRPILYRDNVEVDAFKRMLLVEQIISTVGFIVRVANGQLLHLCVCIAQ
jgi:hypothetical protein